MKILQLCKKIPYPLKDGESIAIHYLSRGLVENDCEVSLLSLNTKKHYASYDVIPAELAHYSDIRSIDIDTTVQLWPLLKNLFSSGSYNIERFDSDDFHRILIEQLQEQSYDVVQLETLYMGIYIPTIRKYSDAKISMRSHNLEDEIWKNLAKQTSNPFKKFYFDLCARRLKNFENEIQPDYDVLLPISISDAAKYKANKYNNPVCMAPVGLDMQNYKNPASETDSSEMKIGYIGSLDWKPNVEGLDWFFEKAWGRIKEDFPTVSFHLAGRNGQGRYDDKDDDRLVIHGEVDDAIEFMNSLDILIVPLFSGSGIRVKILEGMALQKIVISTTKGFEGIPIMNGENGFLFQNENDIIAILGECLNGKSRTENIGTKAAQTIHDNFGFDRIAEDVVTEYKKIL